MEGRAVLIVAATPAEIAPVVAQLGSADPSRRPICRYSFRDHTIDVLTTGVGMVPTAAWCSRALTQMRYDVAFNFGLCGSFNRGITPGEIVHVKSDRLAEVGAEDGDTFLPVQELAFVAEDLVLNSNPPENAALAILRVASGITVNTVHGNERTIQAIVDRLHPDVESMEGAAFMFSCQLAGVPFAQVRAVSNVVERRNRAAWKLVEAVDKLGTAALKILGAL